MTKIGPIFTKKGNKLNLSKMSTLKFVPLIQNLSHFLTLENDLENVNLAIFFTCTFFHFKKYKKVL